MTNTGGSSVGGDGGTSTSGDATGGSVNDDFVDGRFTLYSAAALTFLLCDIFSNFEDEVSSSSYHYTLTGSH